MYTFPDDQIIVETPDHALWLLPAKVVLLLNFFSLHFIFPRLYKPSLTENYFTEDNECKQQGAPCRVTTSSAALHFKLNANVTQCVESNEALKITNALRTDQSSRFPQQSFV